jgi:hypothetical protein
LAVALASRLWAAGPAPTEALQTLNAAPPAPPLTPMPAPGAQNASPLGKLTDTVRGMTFSNARVTAVSGGSANASSGWKDEWIPENLRDPGFDRYVDLALLCQAWEEKNASALADVALQLREGERILLRPQRGFSSQQLLQEAARIAAETKDAAALRRLAKIAETIGDPALKAQVAGAQKLAGEARAADPALQVSLGEMTPEVYADMWDYVHAIQDAGVTGDTTTLNEIKDELASNTGIPEKQKKYLQKLLQENQATAAALPESQKQLGQSLDKLSDSSRGHGGGGHGGGGHGGGGHGGGGHGFVSHGGGGHGFVSHGGGGHGFVSHGGGGHGGISTVGGHGGNPIVGGHSGRWHRTPSYFAHYHQHCYVAGCNDVLPSICFDENGTPASIRIVNPQGTSTTLNYSLEGEGFSLAEGEAQDVDNPCVISFDRANNLGDASYSLTDGTYSFSLADDGGWTLTRDGD